MSYNEFWDYKDIFLRRFSNSPFPFQINLLLIQGRRALYISLRYQGNENKHITNTIT